MVTHESQTRCSFLDFFGIAGLKPTQLVFPLPFLVADDLSVVSVIWLVRRGQNKSCGMYFVIDCATLALEQWK